MGMTNLVGSPNQVAWAERIRAAFIAECEAEIVAVKEGPFTAFPEYDAFHAAEIAGYRRAIEQAARETSATFWIDHRRARVALRTALAKRHGVA
jgi:hypothetical protein